MIPALVHQRAVLFHGDAAELGSVLQPNTVDAIVTDPPAGIGFMGKAWDGDKGGRDAWIAWLARTLAPAFLALKPGGHALVWALPRTSHWTATALEIAGFEIRDRVSHFFGTGFPKSMNCGDGRGTALKPACEDWWLVRKPLIGTVAANLLAHGTGALNIDVCRIGYEGDPPADRSLGAPRRNDNPIYGVGNPRINPQNELGRWPAHVTFDEDAAAALDEQSGALKSGARSAGQRARGAGYADACSSSEGGASRFFYVAKGSRAEKEAGCEALPAKTAGEATDREDGSAGLGNPRAGAGRTGGARNFHPTVKSIALMRWLVRLITPPGGVVLDPFAGSGTTGVAALAEGCDFVGCEQGGEAGEYLPITVARLEHALRRQT